MQLGERQQFLLLNEAFEDETLILDNVVKWNPNDRVEATYVASYTKRDLLVSRDSSALAGSVGVTFKELNDAARAEGRDPELPGFPSDEADIARLVGLPSNLVDTTELEQMTHEVRVSSTDDSRVPVAGGRLLFEYQTQLFPASPHAWVGPDSYWKRGKPYSARCHTPEMDLTRAWTHRTTADLTYDLSQIAVFGEATYHVLRPSRRDRRVALVRLGRRQDLQIGRDLLEIGTAQSQNLTVSSNGLTPRFMVELRRDGPRGRERAGVTGIPAGRRERSVKRYRFVVKQILIPTGGFQRVQGRDPVELRGRPQILIREGHAERVAVLCRHRVTWA